MSDDAARAADRIWRTVCGKSQMATIIREECPTEELRAENARLREALAEYGTHIRGCVLSYWEAGEPASDGGYRWKYGGKWYDDHPPCGCGLSAALAESEKRDG